MARDEAGLGAGKGGEGFRHLWLELMEVEGHSGGGGGFRDDPRSPSQFATLHLGLTDCPHQSTNPDIGATLTFRPHRPHSQRFVKQSKELWVTALWPVGRGSWCYKGGVYTPTHPCVVCLLVPKTVLTFHHYGFLCNYLQMIVFQLVKGLPYRKKDPLGRVVGQGLRESARLSGASWALGWRWSCWVMNVYGILAEAQQTWKEVGGLRVEGGESG